MGNTNTQIRVDCDRPMYYTNEYVTGTVHLNLEGNEEYSNINSVMVVIRGIFKNHTQRNNEHTSWHIYLSKSNTLAFPEEIGGKLNFTQGHYSWPFSIPLVGSLPPTFATPGYELYYYLEVIFQKSRFQRDITYKQHLLICPHLSLQEIPNQPYKVHNFKENTNDMMLNVTINKSAFVSGEQIKVKLEIFNTKRLSIKNVQVSLFYTVFVSPGKNAFSRSSNTMQTICEQTVPSIENVNDEMISKTFEMSLPTTYLPSTFQYKRPIKGRCNGLGYSFPYTRVISLNYSLKINVNARDILHNVVLSLPIMIGTIPTLDERSTKLANINRPNPTDDTNICDDRE